ncbi:MAG: NADP-dependent alcohol dehydrogenase [Syntrophus sp. SKADARSKE-3]|nr:NADP-dependent alcohol dehydrogenase [Syntrophus sp. SKADARSKE-3]
MLNFSYQNPTRIIFGQGCIAGIGKEIPKDSKFLVTYGGGSVKQNGILDEVKAALGGCALSEFGGIEPNPAYETLMQCVDLVRSKNIDFLLAVGGGSVIDGTKFIAAAVPYEGDPWEILEKFGTTVKKALPFGTVLTLPAAGSEMNCGAVITRKSLQAKLPFTNPRIFPKFSVMDPTKTYTLPLSQISNGVVDTFVHIIEQYITYPVNGKVQDRIAEGLLLTLIEEGPKALKEKDNYDIRANLMWCATLGLNGLIAAGVPQDWSTHMVGHEITALHGVDHARTLAVLLPSMLKVRKPFKREKLIQYAERVWGLTDGSEDERIDRAIDKTREFFEAMQVRTRLGDYGITADSIPVLLDQLTKHGMVRLGERRDITPEIVREVLEISL